MSDLKGEGVVNYCGQGIKCFVDVKFFHIRQKTELTQNFPPTKFHDQWQTTLGIYECWNTLNVKRNTPQYTDCCVGSISIGESELIATTNEIPIVEQSEA